MKGMKASFGIMALLAIGAIGCSKDEAKNGPAPSEATVNKPVSPEATDAANNEPASNNEPATNNAPPVVANNVPETNKPADTNSVKSVTPPGGPKNDQTAVQRPTFQPLPGPNADPTWKKQSINPVNVASAVDAKMKTLTNIKMSMRLDVSIPVGEGFFDQANFIADQSRFLVNYADFLHQEAQPRFETYVVTRIKDEKTYSTFVGDKYVPGRVPPNTDVLKGWLLDSTHYLGSGIGTDKKPLRDLVAAAQKAKWVVNVEDKTFDKITFRRIVMESPTLPKKRYEIIIHPTQMLPVAFNAAVLDKKKSTAALQLKWSKSDKPLTDQDLSQVVKTDRVNVISPEEAAKRGLKPTG